MKVLQDLSIPFKTAELDSHIRHTVDTCSELVNETQLQSQKNLHKLKYPM